MKAIIYTSNTGFTRKYAEMLGEMTMLPVYPLPEAKTRISPGSSVLYLGWLRAGAIQGYRQAAGRYDVRAACGVGISASEAQCKKLRASNKIPDSVPVFSLPGGFDLSGLHGIYRLMMLIMIKTVGKKLSAKPDRTPEEDTMMELLLHGGDCVSADNLQDVLKWYDGQAAQTS